MTETAGSKIIPSKVTGDYWVYAFDNLDESDTERENGDDSVADSTAPNKKYEGDARCSAAGENAPGNIVNHDAETEEPKPQGESVDTVLSAVVDDLEKLQTDEPVTYAGKWMLFLDQIEEDENGCTAHDRAWFKIAPLCRDGQLYTAKASTALKAPNAHTQGLGCICCYTEDHRDQEDVRKKADTIRSALEEELGDKVIYYKTDSATLANQYRVLGSGRVSIYRHKPDYSFWKTSADNTSWDILHRNKRPYKFSRFPPRQ